MLKTVLLIDDEPEFVALVRKRLEPFYQILTAGDGEEGLAIALERKPSLVICDILMPKMDGYQFVRELRSHTDMRGVPILLLTTVADTSSLMKAEDLGVTDYLIKPVKLDELPELIAGYIRTGPMRF